MRFKPGQKVKVVQCYSGGNFGVGDIVEIIQIGDDDGYEPNCYGAISPRDNWKWYLNEDEVALVSNRDWIRSLNDTQFNKAMINIVIHKFRIDNGLLKWDGLLKWLDEPVSDINYETYKGD